MKKYFLIISSLFFLSAANSCSERDLELFPPNLDEVNSIDSEAKLQQLLNGAYLSIASSNVYGTQAMVYGDLMADKMFVNSNPSFLNTFNYNYNSTQQGDFGGFYSGLYSVIANCNLVINNQIVANGANLTRIKAEAKTLRALAYFTLVNYYSSSPTSGLNQEYGVPLVLGDYDVNLVPARASVAEVYDQIIADLQEGIINAEQTPFSKVILSQTAAKLILSKVYLTRRAAGDAALALQLSTDIINNSPSTFAPIDANALTRPYNPNSASLYQQYFAGTNDTRDTKTEMYQGVEQTYTLEPSENQPETIWELDLNKDTNRATGIGANIALPGYYYRLDPKKCFLFNQTFYSSFSTSDVRRGSGAAGLLTQTGAPQVDTPKGYWTNKYPQSTDEGRYYRNIKIFRFSEALLNRIEALHLTGQDGLALTELNAFAASRNGSVYTGADMLSDILTERSKEFYGEGQRFLDLKRYNLPVNRPSNCSVCDLAATDKLFVFPVSNGALNSNPNLKQYPGYN